MHTNITTSISNINNNNTMESSSPTSPSPNSLSPSLSSASSSIVIIPQESSSQPLSITPSSLRQHSHNYNRRSHDNHNNQYQKCNRLTLIIITIASFFIITLFIFKPYLFESAPDVNHPRFQPRSNAQHLSKFPNLKPIHDTKSHAITAQDLETTLVKSSGNAVSALSKLASTSLRSYVSASVLESFMLRHQDSLELPSLSIPPSSSQQLTPNDITIIVMASEVFSHRIQAVQATWAQWTPNIYYFADIQDPDLQLLTLPELEGKGGYQDSGQRQLRGMKFLYGLIQERLGKQPSSTSSSNTYNHAKSQINIDAVLKSKWIIFADDDTFLNIPRILPFLSKYPSSWPLAFGYTFDNVAEYWPGISYLHGSAIMLTQESFHRLSKTLYETCPIFDQNDISLGYCMPISSVLKVHSPKIWFEQPRTYGLHNRGLNRGSVFATGNGRVMSGDVVDYLAVHHIQKEKYMRDLTCIVTKSFVASGNDKSELNTLLRKTDDTLCSPSSMIRNAYNWPVEQDLMRNYLFAWSMVLIASFALLRFATKWKGIAVGKYYEAWGYNSYLSRHHQAYFGNGKNVNEGKWWVQWLPVKSQGGWKSS